MNSDMLESSCSGSLEWRKESDNHTHPTHKNNNINSGSSSTTSITNKSINTTNNNNTNNNNNNSKFVYYYFDNNNSKTVNKNSNNNNNNNNKSVNNNNSFKNNNNNNNRRSSLSSSNSSSSHDDAHFSYSASRSSYSAPSSTLTSPLINQHNHNPQNSNSNSTASSRKKGCKNLAFGVLSKDRIVLLDKILNEKNKISSVDQKITIVLSIKEILALMLNELNARGLLLSKYGIRLVGSTASTILSSSNNHNSHNSHNNHNDSQLNSTLFNDIDLSFYIQSRANFMTLLNVEETIIMREVYRQTGQVIGKKEVFDRFFRERVKVTKRDESDQYLGDDWSLITIGHDNARHIDIKFVKRIQRPYAFSIDSFQIILDPLVENYKELLPQGGPEMPEDAKDTLSIDSNFMSIAVDPDQSSAVSSSPSSVTSAPSSPNFFHPQHNLVHSSSYIDASLSFNQIPPVSPPPSSSSSSSAASLEIVATTSSLAGPSSSSSTNSSPLSFSNSSSLFQLSSNLINDIHPLDDDYSSSQMLFSLNQLNSPSSPSSTLPPLPPTPTLPLATSPLNSNSTQQQQQSTSKQNSKPNNNSNKKESGKAKQDDFPPLTTTNISTLELDLILPNQPKASLWDHSFIDKLTPSLLANKDQSTSNKKNKSTNTNNNNNNNSNNNKQKQQQQANSKNVNNNEQYMCVQVFSIFGNYHKAKLDLDHNRLVTNEPRQIRRGIFRYCSELAKGRTAPDAAYLNEVFRETFFTQDKMKPQEFERTLIKYVRKHRAEATSFLKHLESILIQPYKPSPSSSTSSTPHASPILNGAKLSSSGSSSPPTLSLVDSAAESAATLGETYDIYYFDYLNIIANIRSYLQNNQFEQLCEKLLLDSTHTTSSHS